MRKMFLGTTLACLCALLSTSTASACHRGWGWSRYCCDWYYTDCCYPVYYHGHCCHGGYYYVYPGIVYSGPTVGYAAAPTAATLVVDLPADAVLSMDGQRTTSTSAERVFRTPDLEQGRTFEYTLEARVMRAGQEKVIKQRVLVRAGEQTRVRMEEPTTAAAE
jgi:uncharacterized protein (TIGR03000 family)